MWTNKSTQELVLGLWVNLPETNSSPPSAVRLRALCPFQRERTSKRKSHSIRCESASTWACVPSPFLLVGINRSHSQWRPASLSIRYITFLLSYSGTFLSLMRHYYPHQCTNMLMTGTLLDPTSVPFPSHCPTPLLSLQGNPSGDVHDGSPAHLLSSHEPIAVRLGPPTPPKQLLSRSPVAKAMLSRPTTISQTSFINFSVAFGTADLFQFPETLSALGFGICLLFFSYSSATPFQSATHLPDPQSFLRLNPDTQSLRGLIQSQDYKYHLSTCQQYPCLDPQIGPPL